jgi:outer membrane protein, adhesin transport system
MRWLLPMLLILPASFTVAVVAAMDEALPEAEQGLAAALRATMNWHPTIKSQRSEVEALEHAINAAKSGRYPTLSAAINNVNEDVDRGTVQIKQPLWAFGKIDAAIDSARASWVVEQWTLTQVQRKLAEDTAVAYAKMLGIQQQQTVAELNIAEHDKLYQRIRNRQEGQLASLADVNLAKSRLIQAQSRLDRIRGEKLSAMAELQALTQVLVNVDMPVDEAVMAIPAMAEVEKMAIDNSADLQVKREEVVVVGADVKQERLSATPTLYFQVEHEALDQVNPGLKRTQSGLAIEAALGGAGFATLNRIKGAEAKLESAQFNVDSAVNDIRRRVQTLMLGLQIQQNLGRSQQETILVVEETLASFMRQYDTGRKSWIDVLNTQRELTELRYQQVQIDNERLILSLRVAALIGNLDKMAGIEAFNDNQ